MGRANIRLFVERESIEATSHFFDAVFLFNAKQPRNRIKNASCRQASGKYVNIKACEMLVSIHPLGLTLR